MDAIMHAGGMGNQGWVISTSGCHVALCLDFSISDEVRTFFSLADS